MDTDSPTASKTSGARADIARRQYNPGRRENKQQRPHNGLAGPQQKMTVAQACVHSTTLEGAESGWLQNRGRCCEKRHHSSVRLQRNQDRSNKVSIALTQLYSAVIAVIVLVVIDFGAIA
jgi:hypothetical protein